MAVKRLQNRVAESRLALPAIAVYAITMWITSGLFTKGLWLQFTLFVISTYLIVEMNNKYALIRTYSRMVSCSFLVMTLAASGLLYSVSGNIVQLCFVAFYTLLFNCYQNKKSAGWTFYAFSCLGLASLLFVQILYFIPVLWLVMLFNIQSLSFRTFWASIFGIIVPYWILGCYYLVNGDLANIATHFAALEQFGTFAQFTSLTVNKIATFAYVLILAIIGSIHFIRKNYNDKIRIRMIFNTFMVMDLLSVVFIILQPQYYDMLIRLMIINTCPLIGHFITLTKTWITNIGFYIILISSILLTIFNLWAPSFSF